MAKTKAELAAERDRARKGIRARADAIQELIRRHQAEFDKLHADNRIALGLTARSAGPTREQLEERIRKQEEKLAKWREQLNISA